MVDVSVIGAFYNNIEYLKLVLAGFERQTFKHFEFIIADDGSSEEIVSQLRKIIPAYSFPIRHVWQEKTGFRKNNILNKAISDSKSGYLIFIDCDCVPHRGFVEGHILNANQNYLLTGRRVNLSKKITLMLDPEKVRNGFLEKEFFRLAVDGLFGESLDVEKGFYIRNKLLLSFFNRKNRGILGCNFSLFKSDILRVNGFDERYEGPSIGEDTDLQFRLELIGVKGKSINHIAVQYHLYHQFQARNDANLSLFEEVKKNKLAFTPFGLTK